jgi:hypothetical protein
MKLRALSLTNVRRFAGQTATLAGIGDGLTVVCEANEFGKSTFFDALHALFFEKFGATARAVKSLQPYAGGAVKVAAEIETGEGRFQVEKRWLSQKGASVTDLGTGRLIATDGAAESWLAALIGDSRDGPAGLLWVRQGVLGLEPAGSSAAEKAEKERLTETRRDLLSSVAGEIDAMTGGQRMDRVLRRCREDLALLTTPTGRPSGDWKAAQDRVAALEAELARLDGQCRALAAALKERSDALSELARLEAPEARAAREADLVGARAGLAAAEAHGLRLAEAAQTVKIAELERDEACRRLDSLIAAEDALRQALADRGRAVAQQAEAAETAAAARAAAERLGADLGRLSAEVEALRQATDAARRREISRAAGLRAGDLGKRLAEAERQRAEAETARAAVGANPATRSRLEDVEAAANRLAGLRRDLAAGAPSFRIHYLGQTRAMTGGQEVPGDAAVPFRTAVALDLPGVARIDLHPGGGARTDGLDAEVAAAAAALAAALASCAADTPDAARSAAAARDQAEAVARLAEGRLDALAPEGLGVLRAETETAQRAAKAAGTEPEGSDLRSVAELEAALSALIPHEGAARTAQRTAESRAASAEAALAGAVARAETASGAVLRAETQAGPPETRESRRTEAARHAAIAESAAQTAAGTLTALRAAAPDLLTAKANLSRAEAAAKIAGDRRAKLWERRAELSATIAAQADQGVEERRDEVADQLASAQDRAGRLAKDVAAMVRLREVLEAARSAARDAYFGPVQAELAPLLGLLHDEAELRFDSGTLLPSGLVRGGTGEEIDVLSGGTQEQIAILTRLAFARLFARQGRSIPIILDDALVHSDDDRIVRMFTALNRVALDQQILVFSCRQLAFQALGGARASVEIR